MILSFFAALLIQVQLATEEFKLVCDKLQADYSMSCGDLPPPIIVYTKLVHELGSIGVWMHGEDVIFISPLSRVDQREVIIHETVHYTLWHLNVIRSHCMSEQYAREWTAEILNKTVDPNWRVRYGCVIEEVPDA